MARILRTSGFARASAIIAILNLFDAVVMTVLAVISAVVALTTGEPLGGNAQGAAVASLILLAVFACLELLHRSFKAGAQHSLVEAAGELSGDALVSVGTYLAWAALFLALVSAVLVFAASGWLEFPFS